MKTRKLATSNLEVPSAAGSLTRLRVWESLSDVETQQAIDYCAATNRKAEIELLPPDVVKKDTRYRFVIDAASTKKS